MAQAYKCDRCGIFFEENLLTHENVSRFVVGRIQDGNGMICKQYFDLCGCCQSALEEFLLNKTFSPNEVHKIMVIHGQNDRQFKIGETIRYSPSEVEKILAGRVENE